MFKSFKKTIDDGFFPFIIMDAVNERVKHFEEFWSYAKSKGFQVALILSTIGVFVSIWGLLFIDHLCLNLSSGVHCWNWGWLSSLFKTQHTPSITQRHWKGKTEIFRKGFIYANFFTILWIKSSSLTGNNTNCNVGAVFWTDSEILGRNPTSLLTPGCQGTATGGFHHRGRAQLMCNYMYKPSPR